MVEMGVERLDSDSSDWKFSQVPTTEDVSNQTEKEEDFVCGLGSFRPRWMQKLANAKVFLVIFCILGIIEGASFSYTIGVLSSLEKRYAFDSRVSGIILLADNLSSIVISVVVGYYGSHLHRPRWIAAGMTIVAFACFVSASPYFIYGPALHLLNRNTEQNRTTYKLCDAVPTADVCEADASVTRTAVSLLFVGNVLVGFGYTAYYTVGTAYIDDGVQKKNSPIYFGTQMALRLLGPSSGYMLASFFLRYYENPLYDPGLSMNDPRWVGAWWIGFVLLGVLLFLFSVPMFFFPKTLPGSEPQNSSSEKKDSLPKLKEMPKAFLRLIKNRVWFFHTLAIIFHVNGYMGYFVLMPRYMEHHYKQSASGASFFSGSTSIVTMIVGIMLGGIVISRFRPKPRTLTGYMVIISLFSLFAMFSAIFLPCPQVKIAGSPSPVSRTLNLVNECNEVCECTRKVYQPVCGPDGETTFFSPCFAGCSGIQTTKNGTTFSDCDCLGSTSSGEIEESEPIDLDGGMCPFECKYFLAYILVMSISKMIGSTGRVGGMLITLRSVDPKDKNLALGGLSAVISAFAFIPYPLVFGAIADSTCLVWEEKCGKQGNCWVYDTDKLRNYLHGASFGLILIGTFFDFLVFLYSKRVKNFYGEDNQNNVSGKNQTETLTKLHTGSQHSLVAF